MRKFHINVIYEQNGILLKQILESPCNNIIKDCKVMNQKGISNIIHVNIYSFDCKKDCNIGIDVEFLVNEMNTHLIAIREGYYE